MGSCASTDRIRENLVNLELSHLIENFEDIGNIKPQHVSEFPGLFSEQIRMANIIPVAICTRSHESYLLPQLMQRGFRTALVNKAYSPYAGMDQIDEHLVKMVGLQKHHSEMDEFLDLYNRCIRLGELRESTQRAEVSLRDVDLAVFDLDAIRAGDVLGNSGSSPAGLTTEEICLLARYVGASTHLKGVIICGYDEDKDVMQMMAANISLMIYYLLEGYQIRLVESDNLKDNARTYTLVPDGLETELVFYENLQSGRWWLEVDQHEEESKALIACTKTDYEDACQNKISDRLMKIFAKV